MDGKALVFLNGLYIKGDNLLARRVVRGSRSRPVVIAVDGGIGFLQKNGIRPDYWISDLDSPPRIKRGFLKDIETYLFPADKEKTDAELAIDLCAREGLTDISVFGWEARKGETDHLLGSLFLVRNLKGARRKLKLKFINSRQEIYGIVNDRQVLKGYKGRRLSIIPMTSRISLTLEGTLYPAKRRRIEAGETIALRNYITAKRAVVGIEGQGLAIIGGK